MQVRRRKRRSPHHHSDMKNIIDYAERMLANSMEKYQNS